MNTPNQTPPKKGVKLQSQNKLADHIQSLRTLDDRVANYLSKQEQYRFASQEIGLSLGYLLSGNQISPAAKEEELQTLVLEKCIDLARKLNFDPDASDDFGTFMLFNILLKSIFQLNHQYQDLLKKYSELLSTIQPHKERPIMDPGHE